ncbi:MAG: hypothetical protein PHP28_00675 [Actinomycetota bacterium]|nr:hypothetical protein [Actinomycetota bacterium]MDD5667802.1 hypothetical protein [Actinomycetota bacterium]
MQPPPPPPGQPPQAPAGPPRAQLDTSKLPIPDLVVLVGSLLAWIMALVSWYKAKWAGDIFFDVKVTYRGNWQWLPWVIFFLLFLFAAFMVANKFGNFIELNLPAGLIYLGASAAGLLCVILGILIRPGGWDVSTMNWAAWIVAIIFSAIPLVGGYMKMQEA